MPFGLTNAPAVFQALVNNMLNQLLCLPALYPSFFSQRQDGHINHVRAIFCHFMDTCLFVTAGKCESHVSQISFLWYMISKDSLKMGPAKVSTLGQFQTHVNSYNSS